MEPCKPMLGNFVDIYEKQPESKSKKPNKPSEVSADVYRPMHLNPVFYEDGVPAPSKKVSREKRRAAKRFLEDADINEEEDLPVEIHYGTTHNDTKFLAKMREREKYEEENFTRVSLTKKERLMQKRLERGEFLDTNTRMDHIRKLLESSDDDEEMGLAHPKGRKMSKKKNLRRHKGFKGGKGKRGKRR